VALEKKKLVTWLLDHDFAELPGKKTSFRRFRHSPSAVSVTIDAKGRPELSKKHLGMLFRELERAGFNKELIRRELG
jgi:hypothetical protein